MFGFLRCLILRHEVNRKRVRKLENDNYISYCYHCGAKLRRVKRDRWVRDWRRRKNTSRRHEERQEDQEN